jgi:PAS domain S-box-containing protein
MAMPSNSSQQTAGRIVVVGVEPPEVQELETILRFDGFDVTCAPTGAAALRRTQNLPVDLILIGTNSFKTNEVEEFRRFKQDARTCSVPMLFICDELDGKSKTKGFAAGCVDYISKPYMAEEVLHRVRANVSLYRLQHPLVDPTETTARQLQNTSEPNSVNDWRLNGGSERMSDGEMETSNRLRFEEMISNLSARFINLPHEQLDSEIELSLKWVLEFFQVDRCGLLQVLPAEDTWLITHVANSDNASPLPVGVKLSRSINPWAYEKLVVKGEVVAFERLEDVPDEAHVDKQTWNDWGIRSNLVIPIYKVKSVAHIIAINAVQKECAWPEEFIPRLQMLGEIFVSALERRKAEQDLRESEERLHLAASAADAGLWVMEVDTGRIWATDKLREVLHFKPDEPLSFERFLEVVHPEDRESAKATLAKSLQTRDLVSFEYRIVSSHGDTRWVVSQGRSYPANFDYPERLMGVAIDITERKVLEARLKKQIDEINQLRNQLNQENIYLRQEIKLQHAHKSIVARSKAMKRVLAQVEQLAGLETTILLQGETGTGKGLMARTIHNLSNRKDRTLVTINCAALPPTLIENELFGREKGAYTGAMTQMAGRFEAADQSTLFLDEIGDLPLELQAKLLRVLDEGRFERLGSTKSRKVNVRIIAATNRNLSKDVSEGRFRSDLYYRLNVYPIYISPLRERSEDIPPLVWLFVRHYEKKIGRRIKHIPRKCMESLQLYPWPGNARELRNIVERDMIICRGGTLHIHRPHSSTVEEACGDKLVDVERSHILSILAKTGWRITGKNGAAEILGMKRTTLQSRMKKLGIQRPTD